MKIHWFTNDIKNTITHLNHTFIHLFLFSTTTIIPTTFIFTSAALSGQRSDCERRTRWILTATIWSSSVAPDPSDYVSSTSRWIRSALSRSPSIPSPGGTLWCSRRGRMVEPAAVMTMMKNKGIKMMMVTMTTMTMSQ